MTVGRFVCLFLASLLPGLPAARAQQPLPADPSTSRGIKLEVMVDTKLGQPVASISQQDFTILDNKTPRPITSFQVVTPAQEPVYVIFVLDAVNVPYEMLGYMRTGVETFLKAHEGTLAHPTSIGVFDDQGIQIEKSFSSNGLALSDDLEHRAIGLRKILRSTEWSDRDRMKISLAAFQRLVEFAAALPGRKIVLWVSPGWPLFTRTDLDLTAQQEQTIFSVVVSVSTILRQANITVYNINPIGVTDSILDADFYQSYLKGVAKPSGVQFANLGLQVLAIQSGGLTLELNSDVPGMIRTCLADAQSWYEITFDPLPTNKPNEYHHIEVKLDHPGLTARTSDGYYANPVFIRQR